MKTSPKSAANWVHQTVQLFPPTQMVTEQFTATLISLFCDYPESTLGAALDPKRLIKRFQYLPDLNTFKKVLDDVGAIPAAEAQRQERIAQQLKERVEPKKIKGDYNGPIEEVRPGDILSAERQLEYREFMAKKHQMRNIKLWGPNEEYKDTGARPFAVHIPEPPKQQSEKNPFEDL